MSGSQRLYGVGSNGSDRNDGGGGSTTSRGHSNGNSNWVGGASTSTTQNQGYDPDRDSTYMPTYRSQSYYPSHPNGMTNGHASSTAPFRHTPQAQPSRASNSPYQFETAHSSSHLSVPSYEESDFNSWTTPHTSSSADRQVQPDSRQYQHQHQPPIGGAHPAQTASQRSGPYDAVGYIRRDGAVYDEDEVYEEYRPYSSYAQEGEQQQYNGSNKSWQ